MKIWIDLSNSPHPLLFAPIVRRLEDGGHAVLLTARDNAQTVALARERWRQVEVIGGESPGGKPAKAAAIARRIQDLRSWASRSRPDVALSHNSYAQIVAGRSLAIPVVTAMDYEHQPANHLAFRLARAVLVPEVIPPSVLRGQGASSSKVVSYAGLKEELYIGDFEPDPAILDKVGISARPGTLVVFRTPPSRALYHSSANPLFVEALRTLGLQDDLVCVVLPRHPEQVAAIQQLGLGNCIIPGAAIDSRSLMYAADAMIGAGGTMTREAALMGIPTWTLFAGRPPAVDGWLERQGMLARLTRADQLSALAPRPDPPRSPATLRARAQEIGSLFVKTTLAVGAGRSR